MRRKNLRVAIVGIVLFFIAVVFYFFMLSFASKSNNPAALMSTVGTVSGVVCGLAFVMTLVGLIGKKV